eukprot:718204-Amphidinium_carterae.1
MGHRNLEDECAAHLRCRTVLTIMRLAQEHDVVYPSDEVASVCVPSTRSQVRMGVIIRSWVEANLNM